MNKLRHNIALDVAFSLFDFYFLTYKYNIRSTTKKKRKKLTQ